MVIIAVGFLLNTYALYVELKHEYDPSYQALCDVNSVISCTKVITTKWGKGFGILPESVAFRNPIFGFVFYTLMLLMIMAIKPNIIVCKSIKYKSFSEIDTNKIVFVSVLVSFDKKNNLINVPLYAF